MSDAAANDTDQEDDRTVGFVEIEEDDVFDEVRLTISGEDQPGNVVVTSTTGAGRYELVRADEEADEELSFSAEWEIGVHPAGHPDDWEWYHPKERSEDAAREAALEEAKSDGMTDPMVYEVYGPIKPKDPVRVGEEIIERVFGE